MRPAKINESLFTDFQLVMLKCSLCVNCGQHMNIESYPLRLFCDIVCSVKFNHDAKHPDTEYWYLYE